MQLIQMFFEMVGIIKMFHWQTERYAYHEQTDRYLTSFMEKMDELIEILQGIHGKVHLQQPIQITIDNQSSRKTFLQHLIKFNKLLMRFKETDVGFLNVRDEIVSINRKLQYQLTFK